MSSLHALSTASSSSCSSSTASPLLPRKRTRLVDINDRLTCILCNGYFIDATTIVECLHSFCKSCIVQYLENNNRCPICDVVVHKTKPLSNIRSDKSLQDIVYKLIPGLFKNEMQKRREFYATHADAVPISAEDRGEVPESRMFYNPNDKISLSLEYGYGENQMPDNGYRNTAVNQQTEKSSEAETKKRYLLCPAGLTVSHLKKFIMSKNLDMSIANNYVVDIMYLEDTLQDHYSLTDIAYIYSWLRSDPMRLFYRLRERPIKRLKTSHIVTTESKGANDSNVKVSDCGSKLVSAGTSSASSSVCNASNNNSISSAIMTGAAQHKLTKSSNNSKASGVTSTPKHDANYTNNAKEKGNTKTGIKTSAKSITKSNIKGNANGNSAYQMAVTPQGISKSAALQKDEPPTKKLRKILPANSVSTPKSGTKSASVTSVSSTATLRQCRINSLSSVSDESSKRTQFDVRTLIGTKSPPHPYAQQSAISGNECQFESGINNKSSAAKNISTVRDVNRNTITSSLRSMPSPATTGESISKKPLSMASSTAESRPPNKAVSPVSLSHSKIASSGDTSSRPFSPLRANKCGASVSPKQQNAKSVKVTQNDISLTKSSDSRDVTSHCVNSKPSNKSTHNSRSAQQTQTHNHKPQRQSSPLSPTSIRIKLAPPPPKTTITTSTATSTSAQTNVQNNNNRDKNANVNATAKHNELSMRQTNANQLSNDSKSQCKSATVSQNWKSSQPKGASINQIVNKIAKIASGNSVNVTSTTPTLELNKANKSLNCALSLVTTNEVNDDKVSTTTNENGITSPALKSDDDSAIKTVHNASTPSTCTTSTGNLVIRISTKSATVESSNNKSTAEREHKINKFGIKRDNSAVNNNNNKESECTVKSETSTQNIDMSSSESNASASVRALTSCKSATLTHNSDSNGGNANNNNNDNNNNDNDNDEDDDNSLDGGKLVVDVPNEDSCENEVGTSKTNTEADDIDSGRGSDIVRLSCDDADIGSPQSITTTLSIKTPESSSVSSDGSTKSSSNVCTSTALIVSPPPTPSPKSESDANSSVSVLNGPLDLSTNRKEVSSKSAAVAHALVSSVSMRAIYDIPPPKPKQCVNPAVLDKHRGIFPSSSAPNKQHPSFKILPSLSSHSRTSVAPPPPPPPPASRPSSSPVNASVKKDRSMTSPPSANTTGNNSHTRNHHHHHHHNYNSKNYSVVSPNPNHSDPHRYNPKIVIRNISSPPSITSHFNYHNHH